MPSVLPDIAVLDLPLARSRHDRAADRRGDAGLLARLHADPATRVVVLHGDRLAVVGGQDGHGGRGDGGARLAWTGPGLLPAPVDPSPTPLPHPDAADDPADVARDVPQAQDPALWLYLGEFDDVSYVALALPPSPEALAPFGDVVLSGFGAAGGGGQPEPRRGRDARWVTLRGLDALDDVEQGLATQAVALANWHAVYAFCPRCGAPTLVRAAGWVRWCPVEDRELYPRTDAAVIMAVVDDDDRLLLGHAAHWPPRRFSTLAGFVEPGESLEQAVRREVAEEARVTVAEGAGDVVYRGSQAWPFPASLMVGFRARVAGRAPDAMPDGAEVSDARWFTRAGLLAAVDRDEVRLPTRLSIARALIEEWYGGPLPGAW